MTEDAQSDVLKLAAGLRETQAELAASRADAQGRDSTRRRLAREVDILSHLLCSHEASAQALTDASLVEGDRHERDGLIVDADDADDGGKPTGAS